MTRISQVFLVVSIWAAAGFLSAAEKQSLTISETITPCTLPAPKPNEPRIPCPAKLDLTEGEVKAIARSVLGKTADGQKDRVDGRGVMVHVVTYQKDKLEVDQQHWFTADFTPQVPGSALGDLHASQRYKDQRIFGYKNLGLVYVHIIPFGSVEVLDRLLHARLDGDNSESDFTKGMSVSDLNSDIARKLKALSAANWEHQVEAFTAQSKTLPPDRNQLALLWKKVDTELTISKLATTGVDGSAYKLVVAKNGQTGTEADRACTEAAARQAGECAGVAQWLGGLVPAPKGYDYKDLLSLSYGISIAGKDPSPIANLKQILKFALPASNLTAQALGPKLLAITLPDTALAAGNTFETKLNTSDITVTATYTPSAAPAKSVAANGSGNGNGSADKTAQNSATQIGTIQYDNEGRYWYDFSLALPLKSYNELTYDSSANGLTARNVKKNNLYAVVDIGLPRDTKALRFQIVPVLMYGMPIAGQPLKHHLFAASIGLNYVSGFVGTTLDEKNFYHDFSKPLTGSNVFQAWRTHLTYGLNFDAGTVIKALTKKATSGN